MYINHHHVSKTNKIYTIAVIGFIYSMHLVIPMYSNSSFLGLFADEKTVGYIYMTGAMLSILGFLLTPPLIRRYGNYSTIIALIMAQIAFFYVLISATSPITLAITFIIQTALISMIGLCLDIFLEAYTDGDKIGTIRGFYTTTLNASWLIAPLIGSMLINGTDNYRDTYVAALAMLFPLLYLIIRNFPKFKDPNYMHMAPVQLIKHICSNSNWVKLFGANLILQTFYSWMVVYSPIYLHKVIGFNWDQIGIILVVMLLPFALIQYPLGKLADKRYGEKEIMLIGFFIMGISTIALSLIYSNSVWVWALALMATRIGAAAVEIMMEVYFFKTTSDKDTETLGMFRMTRPFSMFLAPLITTIGLMFTTDEYLFLIIGVIVLFGLFPISIIKDTN